MLESMKTLIQTLFHRIASVLRERWYLQLEYLALWHQVEVLKRSARRPRFDPADRCLWLILSCLWSRWPQALEITQADTVRKSKRQGLRHHLRGRRGRKRPGRPPIPAETRNLIREMSRDNRLWGAPRIHDELAKLSINVSRTTVAKYMDQQPGPPSPTWRTFWRTHAPDLVDSEVYAELCGRLRAASTRVLRLIHILRHWLWWFIARCQDRSGCSHATALTELNDPVSVPVVWAVDLADHGRVCGRSPPGSRLSSRYDHSQSDTPIEMGRADVRLGLSVRDSWDVSPPAALNPQTVNNVQRLDGSQQALA